MAAGLHCIDWDRLRPVHITVSSPRTHVQITTTKATSKMNRIILSYIQAPYDYRSSLRRYIQFPSGFLTPPLPLVAGLLAASSLYLLPALATLRDATYSLLPALL
jgi:hypothetical protein